MEDWSATVGVVSRARRTIRRIVVRGLGALVAVQGVVAGAVMTVAWLRRRRQPQGFPHPTFPPIAVGACTLQLYSYGRDLYDAMLAAIDAAQESIYLETYIWKGDAVGQAFKEHLTRKATEGVAVYVIFDRFGNLVVPSAFKAFPPAIQTLAYQGFRRPGQLLDPRRYALEHRKVLVVDGRVGFLGGYNLGSLYATAWRDTHLRLEGPAVAHLAASFVDFWQEHSAPGAPVPRRYPRAFDSLIVLQDNDAIRLTFPIRDMYISAIDRADRRIRLTNAYFIPDRALRRALKAAAQRGADVQVLLPWVSNHTLADWMARGLFTELLGAGIRIFGYRTMLHAKTCTIDGQWSTIGTANLDRLSSVGNYELNAEIYSRALAEQMEQLFERDKANAREVTLTTWQARPWYARVSERVLAPLGVFM
jgi:cardiolipin synthase A/B